VCLEVCGFFNFDFPLFLDLPFYKFEVSNFSAKGGEGVTIRSLSVLYYSKTSIIEIERPRFSNFLRVTVHFDWLNVSILTYSPGERYIRPVGSMKRD